MVCGMFRVSLYDLISSTRPVANTHQPHVQEGGAVVGQLVLVQDIILVEKNRVRDLEFLNIDRVGRRFELLAQRIEKSWTGRKRRDDDGRHFLLFMLANPQGDFKDQTNNIRPQQAYINCCLLFVVYWAHLTLK